MSGISLYQTLCLIGVPSMFAAVIAWVRKKMSDAAKETNAVKKGIQALLRAQMIADYNKWTEKGYAPIYVRENFENCWIQYHGLGANGVMSDIRKRFMELPTERAKEN